MPLFYGRLGHHDIGQSPDLYLVVSTRLGSRLAARIQLPIPAEWMPCYTEDTMNPQGSFTGSVVCGAHAKLRNTVGE